MRRLDRDQRGFTLIELLVVIIVLGLLVGLVGPRLFGRVGQSKQAAAKAQIELIGAGLDQYRLDVGAYPNTSQALDALQRSPGVPNWNASTCILGKRAKNRNVWVRPWLTGTTPAGVMLACGPAVARIAYSLALNRADTVCGARTLRSTNTLAGRIETPSTNSESRW